LKKAIFSACGMFFNIIKICSEGRKAYRESSYGANDELSLETSINMAINELTELLPRELSISHFAPHL